MNHYKKYCCGSMGVFSTYNPLFVGWGKTHVYRGEFWENEIFVGPWNIPEINICESNVCNHGGYIEVYPLYPDTYNTSSINQITYGAITFEGGREEELKEAGFYHIHSDGGYTDFRVPSLELNRRQSKILMEGIMAEIESNDEGPKDQFSFFKTSLNLVVGNNIVAVLDCGKKVYEESIDLGENGYFEFTLRFADQELKLTYTNEQSKLLIECLK